MDFLDGFVARLLKVHSEIGKQLDSLADMVTFGVVPGVVMYTLINESIHVNYPLTDVFSEWDFRSMRWLSWLGFLITIFSAIRLAKFNIDTRQSDSFIGVPTPANCILICSLPLVLDLHIGVNEYSRTTVNDSLSINGFTLWSFDSGLFLNLWFLLGLTLVMSFLLVAELPLFALKFKNFTWTDNKIRFIFLALCLVLLIIFRQLGIPFIIVLYIIMSVVNNLMNRNKNTPANYE
jgi:CDP-diacylglycerol--serine O-phosphatidyltransferase